MVADEVGARLDGVEDSLWMLTMVIPPSHPDHFVLLQAIDDYGDTVFNRLQMPRLLRELQTLRLHVEDPEYQPFLFVQQPAQRREALKMIDELLALAPRVAGDVHTYLRLVGE
jgi:hypothetical protein